MVAPSMLYACRVWKDFLRVWNV